MTNVYIAPSVPASGSTFAALQSGGLNGILEKLIANLSTALAAPAGAPAVNPTGGGATGGLLAPGQYYLKITVTNGFGETAASPEAGPFTVAAANIPQVTLPSLPAGASGFNVYLTAPGGASGTETLYAANVTGASTNLAIAAPVYTQAPPPTNTTALSAKMVSRIRSGQPRMIQNTYDEASMIVSNYLRGLPVDATDFLSRITAISTTFHAVAQALDECGALAAANPGHLTTIGGNVHAMTTRVWP
jgi:hypothetical protein